MIATCCNNYNGCYHGNHCHGNDDCYHGNEC